MDPTGNGGIRNGPADTVITRVINGTTVDTCHLILTGTTHTDTTPLHGQGTRRVPTSTVVVRVIQRSSQTTRGHVLTGAGDGDGCQLNGVTTQQCLRPRLRVRIANKDILTQWVVVHNCRLVLGVQRHRDREPILIIPCTNACPRGTVVVTGVNGTTKYTSCHVLTRRRYRHRVPLKVQRRRIRPPRTVVFADVDTTDVNGRSNHFTIHRCGNTRPLSWRRRRQCEGHALIA